MFTTLKNTTVGEWADFGSTYYKTYLRKSICLHICFHNVKGTSLSVKIDCCAVYFLIWAHLLLAYLLLHGVWYFVIDMPTIRRSSMMQKWPSSWRSKGRLTILWSTWMCPKPKKNGMPVIWLCELLFLLVCAACSLCRDCEHSMQSESKAYGT